MNRIHVAVSHPYDVLVGRGFIRSVYQLARPFLKSERVVIVTDDIVDGLYGSDVLDQLIKNGLDAKKFAFPNGESSKNINTLSEILEFLAQVGLKRGDTLFALGGGVVGDITGLSAALFMRGISFIQVPTTLLAMVDASIGGKTAIDLKSGKNLAGAFWQPSLVICDIDIIEKLPHELFVEGMGEVIKCDIIEELGICDAVLNDSIEENLETIVSDCIQLKRSIVEKDEFETLGIRKLLNVGHTFAHGVEKMSDYKTPHGFAVGTGLVWESAIAYLKGICDKKTFNLIKQTVIKSGLLVDADYPVAELVECMKKDKKNSDDLISFMLPSSIGKCDEYKLAASEVCELLKGAKELL